MPWRKTSTSPRAVVVSDALPSLRGTEPRSVLVVTTLPVGVPEPGVVLAWTVAVKVTGWP